MRAGAARNGAPKRSALAWRFMARYFARYFCRHLDGLAIAAWGRPELGGHRGPLVVYCNHPSWWDAATLILLADRLFPDRSTSAPFDAAMLARYAIFRRLGAFPVEAGTRRGARQFLEASRRVLSRPEGMLWVTAQGRFADVRARPLGLAPGIAHLVDCAPDAVFLPLALEYAFWNERGADAFCAFGPVIAAAELRAMPKAARLAHLEQALEATLDRLGADVIARDPARFTPLLSGARGIGGVCGGWERLKALMRGRRLDPAHDPVHASSPVATQGDAPL